MSSSSAFQPLFGAEAASSFEQLQSPTTEGSGFVPLFGAPAPPVEATPEPVVSEEEAALEAELLAEGPEPVEEDPDASVEDADTPPEVLDNAELQAREDGFEVGRKAGLEAAAAEVQARMDSLDKALAEVATLRKELLDRCVSDIAAATVEISRRMVRRELSVGVGDLDGLVREIFEDLRADDEITVHIAPEDDRAMIEGFPGLHALIGRDATLQFERSPDLTPGGVLIETTFGTVDATVERRFQAFAETVEAWARDTTEAHGG